MGEDEELTEDDEMQIAVMDEKFEAAITDFENALRFFKVLTARDAWKSIEANLKPELTDFLIEFINAAHEDLKPDASTN